MTIGPSPARHERTAPRIQRASGEELDPATAGLLAKLRGFRGEDLNLFSTLARHPRILRKWAALGSTFLDGAQLIPRDRELLILRTAMNCNCHYEWLHHVLIGREVGLSDHQITEAAQYRSAAEGKALPLFDAADELTTTACISEATWQRLATYSDSQLIEICMVVGHYRLTAGVINSLAIEPDRMFDRVPVHLAFAELFAN
jgi:4-carboxymuconolactone decarboxylase